jgi:integrase
LKPSHQLAQPYHPFFISHRLTSLVVNAGIWGVVGSPSRSGTGALHETCGAMPQGDTTREEVERVVAQPAPRSGTTRRMITSSATNASQIIQLSAIPIASHPPTDEQMILLLEACSALGSEYAPRMRALVTFACNTIMRPGELFALDWERDIDLRANEVNVRERVYKGEYDLPKSNRVRTIALLPQARTALLSLPERSGVVFRSKRGQPMSQPTLTGYWSQTRAATGLQHDFYGATKHYGVHYMKVKLDLPNYDIAEQAGWTEAAVEEMVKTYAHTSMGALDRIKAAAEIDALPVIRDADRDAESA